MMPAEKVNDWREAFRRDAASKGIMLNDHDLDELVKHVEDEMVKVFKAALMREAQEYGIGCT